MKKFIFLIASLVLAGSASAQAVKPNNGIYVGVEGGLAQFGKSTAEAGYRVTSKTDTPGYMRGMVGYQITPNWAIEGGYFKTGDGKLSSTNGVINADEKANIKGFDLAAIYKATEMLPGLYFKLGMTAATASVTSAQRAGTIRTGREGSQSGRGYLMGIGYEYDFSHSVSGNVGYTRLQRPGGIDGGINMYHAGLKYRF